MFACTFLPKHGKLSTKVGMHILYVPSDVAMNSHDSTILLCMSYVLPADSSVEAPLCFHYRKGTAAADLGSHPHRSPECTLHRHQQMGPDTVWTIQFRTSLCITFDKAY